MTKSEPTSPLEDKAQAKRPRPSPRRLIVPLLIGGTVVFAVFVGIALYVALGVSTKVTKRDARTLTTAARVAPHLPTLEPPAEGDPLKRERMTKEQFRDETCQLNYIFDDTAQSGVLIDHLILKVEDGDEAKNTHAWLKGGVALVGAGADLEEEQIAVELEWGDLVYVGLIRRAGKAVAWRFLALEGRYVVQLIIGGGKLEQEAFATIVQEAIERFEDGKPCRWD